MMKSRTDDQNTTHNNDNDQHGSTAMAAAINLAKLCIGTGILALPYATLKGGLLFAPIGIAFIALWNWIGCRQMIECKYASAFKAAPDGLSSTYSRIAYCAGGWTAVYITDTSIIITLLGVCVTYQITFGRLLEDFFVSHNILSVSAAKLSLATPIMLAVPVLLTTDVSSLTHLSVAGIVCLLLGVAAIVYFGIWDYGSKVWNPQSTEDLQLLVPLWPDSLDDVSTFIGVATFGFGICSLVFPVEESMRVKKDFDFATFMALTFVWFIYSIMGTGVSVLFVHDPDGVASNILFNLPGRSVAAEVVRVSFAIVCLLTFPLAFLPPISMIENYILQGIDFISSSGDDEDSLQSKIKRFAYDYESIRTTTTDMTPPTLVLGATDSDIALTAAPVRRASSFLRCTLRMSLLGLCTAIACAFPCFGLLVSLLGCFTVTILSFVLPPFFRLMLVAMPTFESTGEYSHLLTDVFMTGAGALLCIISTSVVSSQIMSGEEGC
jgi:proton-coupled amino acid transporter